MKKRIKKYISLIIAMLFTFTQGLTFFPKNVNAAELPGLPSVGSMVSPTATFNPPVISGISVYPENPLKFDFMIDGGDLSLSDEEFQKESSKLIQYFMASLTTPKDQMWVNLSPYEENRIIPDALGQTQMGQDLLAQDYLLKQLTASLMHPETETGNEFWDRVYAKAYDKFGSTDVPTNTFHKIWIVPDIAEIYEHEKGVFIIKSHLKVLLEEDYLALNANKGHSKHGVGQKSFEKEKAALTVSTDIIRTILIPEIEKEVNNGELFSELRQIYHSMILASWYKKSVKNGILNQIYVDQNQTQGIKTDDQDLPHKIFSQYVKSFETGVFDFIQEDYDPVSQEVIPRRYFSGGVNFDAAMATSNSSTQAASEFLQKKQDDLTKVTIGLTGHLSPSDSENDPSNLDLDQLSEAINQTFEQYDPESFKLLHSEEIPFSTVALELFYKSPFFKDELNACKYILTSLFSTNPLRNYEHSQEIIEALQKVIQFSKKITPQSAHFNQNIAYAMALYDYQYSFDENDQTEHNLIDPPLPNQAYLDLASGPGFADYLPNLNPDTHYIVTDTSPIVAEYLQHLSRLFNIDNLEVLHQDVLSLTRPKQPLGVIRIKNAWRYVDNLSPKLIEMSQWLEDGGKIIIQTEPIHGQRKTAFQFMSTFAEDLINQGWDFEFEFSNTNTEIMDKFIFIKEHTEIANSASKIWDLYIRKYTELMGEEKEDVSLAEQIMSPHSTTNSNRSSELNNPLGRSKDGEHSLRQLQNEIESAFQQFDPDAFDRIISTGVPFHSVAIRLIKNDSTNLTMADACSKTAHEMIFPYSWNVYENQMQIIEDLNTMLKFSKKNSEAGIKFIRNIAQLSALIDLKDRYKHGKRYAQLHFPNPEIKHRAYIDLASGPNFSFFLTSLDPTTHYFAVDSSAFVIEYLNQLKEKMNITNLDLLQTDINDIKKPQMPVGTIRVKNAWVYVENLATKIKEMIEWIEPDGQLIIQNEPNKLQRKLGFDFMENFAQELIAKGWHFNFELGNEFDNTLDIFVFTREGESFVNQPGKMWGDYLNSYNHMVLEGFSRHLFEGMEMNPEGQKPYENIQVIDMEEAFETIMRSIFGIQEDFDRFGGVTGNSNNNDARVGGIDFSDVMPDGLFSYPNIAELNEIFDDVFHEKRVFENGFVLESLRGLSLAEYEILKSDIMSISTQIYENESTMFPATPELIDDIMEADLVTGFSQIVRSKDGELAGFVLAYQSDSSHINIEKIAVVKDYRKQGIGQKLLEGLAANAVKAKIREISLAVLKTNINAMAFYERFGFKNTTPSEMRNDPRYNAFGYTVNVDNLIQSFDHALATSPNNSTKGGIDLNPELLTFKTKFSSSQFKMPTLSQEAVDQMIIDGYSPVIINIAPMGDPSVYLNKS